MKKSFVNSWPGLLITVAALYGAMWLGTRWDAVAVPEPDVRVFFNDGRVAAGTLTHTFAGQHVLTTSDGQTLSFSEDDYRGMSWPATERSALVHWRAMLPLMIVVAIWSLLAWGAIRQWLVSRRGSRR